jgi:uroporphyrinogen decarboxylase
MRVFLHSCGAIGPIIPDLIEIGLDILNPVQPECLDPVEVKRRYGDRLTLWGSIGVQSTLRTATPNEVRSLVQERIAMLGANGGFVLAPANALLPDTSWENVFAMWEASSFDCLSRR